ncbi:Glycerate 2-kinase [Planctomycetes bacterium Poly30]|uniref:Glycerate 2-kinase n=1 Tax=Saltatorellus ferox TaxID=2528018 RepID=A0A518ELR0_9BACT|nr:Glycerate 2-kinase [Planctomycetes bacterium Poly30]
MRCLIANDKFKGSLTALEAASAIAAGLPAGYEVDLCPIADGGEGFTETMCAALSGRWVTADVSDALGRPIRARYAVTDAGVAVMEMAAASGLLHVHPDERSPLRASTFGTGEMLRHAARQRGVSRILIGLGGSATNDGGVGMASALGISPVNGRGRTLDPWPSAWGELAGFDATGLVAVPPIQVASDVTNPLLGPKGATAVFGAQKGASEAERRELERHLARLVEVTGAYATAKRPGAGAAGGLGFGLMHFLGAELRSGFELVAEALDLKRRIQEADFVITGEGSMDAQSLDGKGPVGVAQMATSLGRPAYAVGGRITGDVRSAGLFQACASLDESGLPLETLIRQATTLLTEATKRMMSQSPPPA